MIRSTVFSFFLLSTLGACTHNKNADMGSIDLDGTADTSEPDETTNTRDSAGTNDTEDMGEPSFLHLGSRKQRQLGRSGAHFGNRPYSRGHTRRTLLRKRNIWVDYV